MAVSKETLQCYQGYADMAFAEHQKNMQTMPEVKTRIMSTLVDEDAVFKSGIRVNLRVNLLGDNKSNLTSVWLHASFEWVSACCGALFVHSLPSNPTLYSFNDFFFTILKRISSAESKGMWHYYVSDMQPALKNYLIEKQGFEEGSRFVYNPNSGNKIQLLYKDLNKK